MIKVINELAFKYREYLGGPNHGSIHIRPLKAEFSLVDGSKKVREIENVRGIHVRVVLCCWL